MPLSVPYSPAFLQWDIFCKVIDNFGDIGICWRLAADLAKRGHRVRLWADDVSALAWMAPGDCEAVQVLRWTTPLRAADLDALKDAPGDVLIEAFGCEVAPEFIASSARICCRSGLKPVWINLEYLSAEPYVERNHGLPSTRSAAQGGPAAGWTKWFFYPGFTALSGGLLREPGLAQRQAAFDRAAWLRKQDIAWEGETLVSMFCYEPPALTGVLRELADKGINGEPVRLLVAAGRAQGAVISAMAAGDLAATGNSNEKGLYGSKYKGKLLSISYLPLLSQADFDHLLWACDLAGRSACMAKNSRRCPCPTTGARRFDDPAAAIRAKKPLKSWALQIWPIPGSTALRRKPRFRLWCIERRAAYLQTTASCLH
jgi:uncharacterized repeat protein (TIGR03837 family)